MSWDDGLSSEQKAAASHIGQHARLLAGPGTGKTLSLTRRIIYLIKEVEVPASEILVVTFTRAAMTELRNRLASELGQGAILPHIATLHSFALSTILQSPSGTRLPQPIRIADDYEERWIVQEDLKEILGARIRDIQELMNKMSADWEQLTADVDGYEERFPNPEFLAAWREHRRVYGYTLRAELVYQLKNSLTEGGIDFYDPPQYVLVDEYQDLNACDLSVIHSLVNSGAELYGAGDDDQSIYAFRYANPNGIRNFSSDFDPSRDLELVECKRCDSTIIDLGLFIARQDPRRFPKLLRCSPRAGEGLVELLRFPNQNAEAQSIADICKWLVDVQHLEQGNILILFRSDHNRQFSKLIQEYLARRGLNFSINIDPLAPLNCLRDDNNNEQVEGRCVFALMRLLVDRNDSLAWRTLLKLRANNIGSSAISALYGLSRRSGETFSMSIQRVKANPGLIPRFGSVIKREIEEIELILVDYSFNNPDTLYEDLSQFVETQVNSDSEREDVLKLFRSVLRPETPTNLPVLIQSLTVTLGDKEQDMVAGAINMMTMHQAKGLTADAVFIIACEDEYIPGRNQGELEEDERRLLYVSITRAKHYVFITHCQNRTGSQQRSGRNTDTSNRTLCRFLSGGLISSRDGQEFCNSLNQHI
jgi:DNA helicase-2/ATP-dependent DNA helicase PcrA